ncbi:hypothetical protein CUX29_RS22800 [Vibrio parahaemolyticus]|nr:hypothetical protein [Vibrio parahaemolyticus]
MSRPNFEETIIIPPLLTDWQALPLITDTQYLEPLASNSLNRKFYGIVRAGVFRGFECAPVGGMKLRVSSGEQFGVALVERDDYILTVRQQHDIDVEIPAGATSYVVLEAFYKHGVKTKQVDLSSDVEASEIKVLPQSAVEPHHLILCRATVPTGASELTLIHLNFDDREQGGYDLQGHVSHPDPHKQYAMRDEAKAHYADHNNPHGVTKEQIGLGNVPNYPATSSVSDPSNEKFATAGAVKQAYDKGVEGLDRGNAAYTRAEQAETNANKHTDDRISTLLGGAPAEALDTIKELGDALMEQGDAAAAIAANIAQHKSDTSNPHKVTKAQVGLANVPNYAFTAAVNDASDVKFAAAGAVKKAYDLAASKMTQAQADGRYLKLSGGTITDILSVGSSKFLMEGVNMMGAGADVTRFGDGDYARPMNLNAKDGVINVINSAGAPALRVYHEGYKPTPASINAIEAETGSNRTPDLNAITKAIWGWTDSSTAGKPSSGSTHHVLSSTWNNGTYGTQFATRNAEFHVRTKENGVWNDWNTVYHTGNKPTASEVGAVSKAGDVMTGALAVQGLHAVDAISPDAIKMSGYGVMANRSVMYLHNANADGKVSIGVGGNYGENVKLAIRKDAVESAVPITVQGSNVITEELNRTKVVQTSLGSYKSWCQVANVTLPQASSVAVIEFFGGDGYNVGLPHQSSRHQVILRAGNNNPKGLNGQAITDHPNGLPFDEFGWVNTSGDNYEIYVKTRTEHNRNILIRYMCSHTITPYVINKGAAEPAGLVKGLMVTSYTSFNKNLDGVSSSSDKGLVLDYNGKSAWIGCRNTSWFHLETDATNGFYSYSHIEVPTIRARGTATVLTLNATGSVSGEGITYNGKTAIGGSNDTWLRLNPHGQFTNGIYCGGTGVLRHDWQLQIGAWGSGNKVSRVQANHYDSSWGNNGIAAFSVNNPNSSGAHWAFASYYDANNIRSGMQILSNSGGNIRFYTNGRSKYAEIVDGNVYVSASQSSAAHSLTRKDYVDSEISKTKLVLEHLFPVGHVIITFNTANPSTYGYPGTWVRMDNDTTLYSTTGTPSTTPKGSNTPNVPVAAHTHKYARVTKYRNQGNTNPGFHEIDMPTDNTWGLAVETGRSTPRTVAMSFMGNMENTASSGTSGATLDVRGKRYDVAMWRRTA